MKTELHTPSHHHTLPQYTFRTTGSRSFFRRVGVILVVSSALFVASMVAFVFWHSGPPKKHLWFTNPFQPQDMALLTASEYSQNDVQGNLGGMPIKIPRYFANFVEYNGALDRHEQRQHSMPAQTQNPEKNPQQTAELASFGFYTRFPDMAGLTSPALVKNKAGFSTSKTMWMDVEVNTGEIFPGTGFMDRRTIATVETPHPLIAFENYEKLLAKEFGLTVYSPPGTDPTTHQPNRLHAMASDVFIHRNADGTVDALIQCSNRPDEAALCDQTFTLEPFAKAEISVAYRRGMLSNWKEIQHKVAAQILNFKVPQNGASALALN